MTLVAFVTSSATTGALAPPLATGDDLLIAPGVAVARTDIGTAITGIGSSNIGDIYGLLAADTTCIFLGDDGAVDNGHRITVHEDGIVRSYSSGGGGIALRSFNSRVTNLGTITALGEGVIVGGTSTTTQSVVENSGTIIGDNNAVVRFSDSTETVVVINSGLISSADDAYFSSGANLGIDLLTNTGRMVGDIELSGGNDAYNGASGRLTGKIFAGAGNDTIIGGIDSDWFEGGSDNDVLRGNGGNDRLDGGIGNDQMFGGTGNDSYIVNSLNDIVNETGGNGIDTVFASTNFNLGIAARVIGAVENLTLTGATAIGVGNGLANVITGNGAANTLHGGAGNDTLRSSGGNDILIGGAGTDLLNGGTGDDIFRFTAGTSPVGNPDVIVDFDDFGNDRIDVSALFGPAMVYRHNGAFTGAGQVRINDVAGPHLLVEVNTGGSLAADFAIRLTNTVLGSMGAGDFIL